LYIADARRLGRQLRCYGVRLMGALIFLFMLGCLVAGLVIQFTMIFD